MGLNEKQLKRAKKKLDELFNDPLYKELLLGLAQECAITGTHITDEKILKIINEVQKRKTPLWKALNS